jgi:hypothetical protein
MARKIGLALLTAIATSLLLSPVANAAISVSGANGAILSISKNVLSRDSLVQVSGKSFDETVGIYLAYCLVPKKGQPPTPCGGGVNKTGTGEASFWISSNPPPYGIGLAIPFNPGGQFSQTVAVTRKLGKYDCKKVKCAITVRSDHLHEGDRSHDIFIPITFK